ncbi:Cyclin-dependent kinase inhibitor domain-containing protein [Dioscorea alata]|uniref:Cyclin-dependent kinase inhibitor domain-containing protein n=1 Tax=Dioscorea alata TaxID=55571 RepID=A0ACB7WRJ0_DIOAL|nr:Cyclin-dependent kinase inhibitor domain-containing protein [Dioscorea alata]
MGKYMKKTKVGGEVALMEVGNQSSLGVRTRARTLALQRLQKPSDSSPDPPSPSSYLQLRSRRLEKPVADSCPKLNPRARATAAAAAAKSVSVGSVSLSSCRDEPSLEIDGGVEVSFGENVLEVEERDRSARETTPCSLIRNSETIGTPGSTTRVSNSGVSSRRIPSSSHRNYPTTHEMEEFFARAEELQQRVFIEKYNFDPVNDLPLPGRYEWVKLDA